MADDKVFSGGMDPEIAELMGITPVANESAPEFTSLFEDSSPANDDSEKGSTDQVDITKKCFDPITIIQQKPQMLFKEKNFYKKILTGGGEESKRVHSLLSKFLNTEDPKERSLYRGKLISAYWNFASNMITKIGQNLSLPKQVFIRFGVLLPTLITQEQRNLLGTVIFENTTGEPVYFADEWMLKVASGQISSSATDEVKVSKKNSNTALQGQIDKARGNQDTHIGMIRKKINELEHHEDQLKGKIGIITNHRINDSLFGLKEAYSPDQKKALSEIAGLVKQCGLLDKEITGYFSELNDVARNLKDLESKVSALGDNPVVDNQSVVAEFNTVRQMVKLTIGRQGNHVPLLMKQYFRASIRDIGTRENVINYLAQIEKIDPGVFERTFKRQTNRIVPYILLLPTYGDRGICWEPFEKFNRATSRGRIAVPMYPKDLFLAVISAAGDLRWQVAKEKAQHYWMEEGLTGRYYQWFTSKKIRGDVKEYFIQDYLLWISKESEGMQKLDKEVRGVFWRYIPFPQDIKDNLKNRGFVYNELHKKDVNRSISDGY